ncbi:WD40 repeat protein [Labedaea rhizosphaerae]|uniref:WD40 repeat protein n=1 Tax=Labedaea rhizosphaerae TaxID=598644 RepID=A0A4R6SID6_LABRH|nr:WD40 repeat protein [Labedaea rhizosphaerae]
MPAVVLVLFAGVLVAVGGPAAAAVAPGDTQLASVRDDGSEPPFDDTYGDSMAVSLSQDGRYVGFDTIKALDPADPDPPGSYYGNRDVYVRDLRAPGHTVLISRPVPDEDGGSGSSITVELGIGAADPSGESAAPALSATGRFVAFQTTAANLPDNDRDAASDVVVCDRDPDGNGVFDEPVEGGGTNDRYVVVGRAYQGGVRAYTNDSPSISADGMTLAWRQHALGGDYATTVVAVHLSTDDGVLLQPQESDYIDLASAEHDQATEVGSSTPKVSADGRQVAFVVHLCGESCVTYLHRKPLLALDGAPVYSNLTVVEVEDLTNRRTVRVDYEPDGHLRSTGYVYDPAISGDGRVVVYQAQPDYSQTGDDVVPTIMAVDRDPDGDGKLGPGDGEPVKSFVVSRNNNGEPGYAFQPSISADGRYVAFATSDQDMSDGVTPGSAMGSEGPPSEIVVRDIVVDQQRAAAHQPQLPGELATVSVQPDCGEDLPPGTQCGGSGSSYTPSLSGDGRVVAFDSRATDLMSTPLPCCPDRVYARTFRPFAQADPAEFGQVPLGSSQTRTITVRHNGFSPLRITGVTVSGVDFDVFPAQTCAGATLYETGSCLVSVRFAPTAVTGRAGTLRIDVVGAPPTVVSLTGAGGGVATGFVAAPNPLVFTAIKPALAPTGPAVVTIANRGPVPWNIGAVKVIGGPHLNPGDFKITANTCANTTVPAGGTCRVTVVATGHGAGLTEAVLSIADTSAGGPHLVGLLFTTTVPTLQVSPAALPSGRVATVTGQGFPLDHDVTVSRPGSTPVTAHTSATGTFTTPLVIFDHAVVGPAPVVVTAPGTTLHIEAPLLVVLGTFQPPGFTGRR